MVRCGSCEQMCAGNTIPHEPARCNNEHQECPSAMAYREETQKLDVRGVLVLLRHVRQQRLLASGAGDRDLFELQAGHCRAAMDAVQLLCTVCTAAKTKDVRAYAFLTRVMQDADAPDARGARKVPTTTRQHATRDIQRGSPQTRKQTICRTKLQYLQRMGYVVQALAPPCGECTACTARGTNLALCRTLLLGLQHQTRPSAEWAERVNSHCVVCYMCMHTKHACLPIPVRHSTTCTTRFDLPMEAAARAQLCCAPRPA